MDRIVYGISLWLTQYGLVTPFSDKSRSTLAQVMAWCLTATSYYLNQYWLIIHGVLWHSPKTIFIERNQDINLWNEFEKKKHFHISHLSLNPMG